MNRLLATVELLGSSLGSLALVAMHLAFIGGAVFWNFHEYRYEWRSARPAWWTLKASVPISGIAIVGIALLLAQGTEGFVGLAAFYGAIFLWLICGPLLSALVVARVFEIRRGQALRAGISMLVLIVTGWFSGHGAENSMTKVTRSFVNFDKNREYKAFEIAADHPAAAGDSVRLVSKEVFRLPDGRRLVHLAYSVEPNLKLYRLEVRVPKKGKRPFWSSTIGHCPSKDQFHITNVLDKAEWFEARVAWHRGKPETMIGVEERVESLLANVADATALKVRVLPDHIEINVPIPRHYVEFKPVGSNKPYPYVNYTRTPGLGAYDNGCLQSPIKLPERIEGARLTFYSEELYQGLHYDFELVQ